MLQTERRRWGRQISTEKEEMAPPHTRPRPYNRKMQEGRPRPTRSFTESSRDPQRPPYLRKIAELRKKATKPGGGGEREKGARGRKPSARACCVRLRPPLSLPHWPLHFPSSSPKKCLSKVDSETGRLRRS